MNVYININDQGHMAKMAARTINGTKYLENLQSQKAYEFETWHEASVNGALQSLYKS